MRLHTSRQQKSKSTRHQKSVGGATWEVDPYSIDDIAAGMERLLGDPALRDELVAKGLRRAAELTWDATVAQTCAVYRGLSA